MSEQREFHILGYKFSSGEKGRFLREITNEEFEKISNRGLPSGWVAWHNGTTDWKRVGELPIIADFVGAEVDPTDILNSEHRDRELIIFRKRPFSVNGSCVMIKPWWNPD